MRHLALSLVAGLGLLLAAGTAVQAAPHINLDCPADARGVVSYSGADTGWVATTQSSAVLGLSIESIGSQPALVCKYRMFGGEYWIYRRPDPAYPNCRLATDRRNSFYCSI